MAQLYKLLIFNLIFIIHIQCIEIRVLIDKIDIKNSKLNFQFYCQNGFKIINKKQNVKNKNLNNINSKNISISYKRGSFYLDNRKLDSNYIYISDKNSFNNNIKYLSNYYLGVICLLKDNNYIYIINHINLENYVLSVASSEIWPGWPSQVCKALIICFRTYAINQIINNKKNRKFYDIKNSNFHQVYKGNNIKKNLIKDVESTKDLIISYNGKPILAMYDISCGSLIPAKFSHYNFNYNPYLLRNYPCYYCKNFKVYSWDINIKKRELEKILQNVYKDISSIKSITCQKDNAGITKNVEISYISRRLNKKLLLSAVEFRTIIHKYSKYKIKSLAFNCFKSNDSNINIKGNGYGHLIGLCQWGAFEMAKRGFDYKSIIKFYYPKTEIVKIKYKK